MILFALLFVVAPAFAVGLLVDPAMGILTIIALEILLMKVPVARPKAQAPLDLEEIFGDLLKDHPDEPEPEALDESIRNYVAPVKAALPSRDTNWLNPEHPHRS